MTVDVTGSLIFAGGPSLSRRPMPGRGNAVLGHPRGNHRCDPARGGAAAAGIPVLSEPTQFRWHRTVAVGYAIVFVIIVAWTWVIVFTDQKASDFLSYWAAARLAADATPALAYDITVHRALELSIADPEGLLPFPYPPPFLLLLLPLGLAPYWLAFALWVASTVGLYLLVSRGVAPLAYRLAHPQALANALIGQNGFLTTAMFVAGMRTLERQPLLGGAILGLLVIKPQLAVLLPIALLAGREWRAIAGAAASSIALLSIALLIFGMETYRGFFDIVPVYAQAMATSRWPWNELASVFAFARHLGVPQQPALIIHAIVALGATALVWRAWIRRSELRVPVLAAAILLVPPYLFTYDALLLIVPMGWLVVRERGPVVVAVAWLCCLLPVVTYIGFYPGPNPIPIAALLCLWALHAEQSRRAGPAGSVHAPA